MTTSVLLAASGGEAGAAPLDGQPPNIVFILLDDQGVESIEGDAWWNPAEEDWVISTPAMRRFAQQGVSYTNCRVNPNCSPTRAAIMTGRGALQTGVNGVLPRSQEVPPYFSRCDAEPIDGNGARLVNRLALQTQERTLAEVLRDAGYYTILIDKWHLGYNAEGEQRGLLAREQGFDVVWEWKENLCVAGTDQAWYADAHMKNSAAAAVNAVQGRPDPNQPYALFFHTIMPHRMWETEPKTGPEAVYWWEVWDRSLLDRTAPLITDRMLVPATIAEQNRF